MWDFTVISSTKEKQAEQSSHAKVSEEGHIDAHYLDAVRIQVQISKALAKSEFKVCTERDQKVIDRYVEESTRLSLCLNKINEWIKKLETFQEIQKLQIDCREKLINPKHRIILGGRILQDAIDEMNEALSQYDPVQDLDHAYEQFL